MTKNSSDHQKLIRRYLGINSYARKLDRMAMLVQASIFSVIISWKPAKMPYPEIAPTFLVGLSLYFFCKDLFQNHLTTKEISKTILQGLKFEKSQKEPQVFFHDAFEKINLRNILFLRSVFTLLFFGMQGYLAFQNLLPSLSPFSLGKKMILSILGAILPSYFVFKGDLKAFKELSKAKIQALSSKEQAPLKTKSHQDYILAYEKLRRSLRKTNFLEVVHQVGTLGTLYLIKNYQTPAAKLGSCFLVVLAIFFLARDYRIYNDIDKKLSETILNGCELEKKEPNLKKVFFHILKRMSIVKILVTRSVCTALFVLVLTSLINKIFFGHDLFVESKKFLMASILAIVGATICILYYRNFKGLDDAKSSNF